MRTGMGRLSVGTEQQLYARRGARTINVPAMAPTRALVAFLLVLTLGTGVAVAISGEPVLSATLESEPVSPGEETTLDITILNNGSVDVGSLDNPTLTDRVTTARGLTIEVDPDDDAPVTVHAGSYAVGSLPEGGEAPLSVPVTVDEDADPGEHRVPINVTYRYTEDIDSSGEEDTETVRRDLNVTLRVDPGPRFRVRDVSTPLRVGSTDTVSVTVENVGAETARDARVSLSSANADLTFGGSAAATRFVGDWAGGENRTVAVQATASDAASPQNYSVDLQATYEDEYGRTQQSESNTLAIQPGPEQHFVVENVASDLAVDDEGHVNGTVRNTGSEPATNAVVIFAHDGGTVSARQSEYPVGTLAPGESAAFSFPLEVGADAEPGPRQFSVSTRYRTGDDTVVESPTIDVSAAVGEEVPAFEVAAADASVEPGGSRTINLSVTNRGSSTYTDVSAKLFAESPLSANDDEAYVRELAPGESSVLTFSIAASGGALQKDYPISLDFRYDDGDGDTLTSDTYRRAVTVVAPPENGGPPILLIGAVVIIVLLGAGYYWTRR